MNRRSIAWHQCIEFAKAVGDGTTVKTGRKFASLGVDVGDVADVAVINLVCTENLNSDVVVMKSAKDGV